MIAIRIIIGAMIAFGCFNACIGLSLDAISEIDSELTTQRATAFFNAMDSNFDGIVLKRDICVVTDCISENLRFDEKKKKNFCDNDVSKAWIWLGFDKAESGNGFHKNMMFNIMSLGKRSSLFKDGVQAAHALLFNSLRCHTKNITITYDQFRAYHSCVQSDPTITLAAFEKIDVNKDGGLSEDEFCNAAVDFMTGEDKDGIGSLFFGRYY